MFFSLLLSGPGGLRPIEGGADCQTGGHPMKIHVEHDGVDQVSPGFSLFLFTGFCMHSIQVLDK